MALAHAGTDAAFRGTAYVPALALAKMAQHSAVHDGLGAGLLLQCALGRCSLLFLCEAVTKRVLLQLGEHYAT